MTRRLASISLYAIVWKDTHLFFMLKEFSLVIYHRAESFDRDTVIITFLFGFIDTALAVIRVVDI